MTQLPTPQRPHKAPDQPRSHRITRKVRDAIAAMVWEGLKRPDAAEKAGMTDNGLYVALRRPDVKAFYLAECEVLRMSGRARRIHRLGELAEQNSNMNAAVNAIRAAEGLEDQQHGRPGGGMSMPGFIVQIVQPGAAPRVVDATPAPLTIEHEPEPAALDRDA